jgi:signal transduction histidine kinase
MAGADPEQFAEMRRLRKINRTLGNLYLKTFLADRVERRNLSLRIEDDVVQHLVGAKLMLSTLKKQGSLPIRKLESIEDYLAAAIEATRRVTEKLSPNILEVAGLEDALNDLCLKKNRLHRATCHIDARGANACLTDKTSSTIMYGIACRLLDGFLELESADTIRIWLYPRENSVHLIVEDNSHDFDIEDITHPDEFPDIPFLVGLREEIRCLNGEIKIERTSEIRITTITLPHIAGCLEY